LTQNQLLRKPEPTRLRGKGRGKSVAVDNWGGWRAGAAEMLEHGGGGDLKIRKADWVRGGWIAPTGNSFA